MPFISTKIKPRQPIPVSEALSRDKQIKLDHLEDLVEWLPPLVARTAAPALLGGLRERRTMEKDDSAGCGPELVVHLGTKGGHPKVAYPRRALLRYIERAGMSATLVNNVLQEDHRA